MEKIVCLGFVRHHEGKHVTPDYITSNAKFEINIAGRRVSVKALLQAPKSSTMRLPGQPTYKPRVIVTQN